MAINQKRRQKALLKKRRKDRERRKKQARFSDSGEYSNSVRLIKNAKNYPLHECLIDKEWQDRGLAQILFSRRQPNNKLIFGVYLVDIYCLGLKNTYCHANFSLEEYQDLKNKAFKETIEEIKSTLLPILKSINKALTAAREFLRPAIDWLQKGDPYFNPNFTLDRLDYSIKL